MYSYVVDEPDGLVDRVQVRTAIATYLGDVIPDDDLWAD